MQRQRPLQNSMILPETNYSLNQRPSIQTDYHYQSQTLKNIPMLNETQFIQHHNVSMQPTRQFGSQNNFEDHQQIIRNNDPVHEIFDRLEKLTRVVDKHDLQLGSLLQQGELSRRVLHDFKKGLPAFNGNNDISQQLLTLKLEIKDLYQELAKTPKMPELEQNIKKQIQASTNKNNESSASTIYSNNSSKQIDFEHINELIRKRDQHYQNLLANLQTQISMVKKNLGNMHLEMKVSPISSSSCILVKYQQLFKARSASELDMVINEYTYYIDNEGHLLDCHSRYIVDQKGKKIKLQDSHINILRNQKILY